MQAVGRKDEGPDLEIIDNRSDDDEHDDVSVQFVSGLLDSYLSLLYVLGL